MKFRISSQVSFILIFLVLPLFSLADEGPSALFEKGNSLYAKEKYQEALATYRKLIDEGYKSAEVYFNAGNACYKTGDIPSALLYYEKAHKLAPGDDDINFNLQYVNLKTTDKIDEVPVFFLTRWWHQIILSFSINILAAASIILIFIASGLLSLYFFANSVAVKKLSFYAAFILFFSGVFIFFIAGRQVSYFDDHKQAIVFSGAVTVKSAPVEKAGVLFVIHEGTKVNILEENDGWMKISLANGNAGWIKNSVVKDI